MSELKCPLSGQPNPGASVALVTSPRSAAMHNMFTKSSASRNGADARVMSIATRSNTRLAVVHSYTPKQQASRSFSSGV